MFFRGFLSFIRVNSHLIFSNVHRHYVACFADAFFITVFGSMNIVFAGLNFLFCNLNKSFIMVNSWFINEAIKSFTILNTFTNKPFEVVDLDPVTQSFQKISFG